MLWLKRCVVPTSPHDVFPVELVYLVVRLACGERLALVFTSLANIQSELRCMGDHFCMEMEFFPMIDMAYTYLIAWCMMHCSPLMDMPSTGGGVFLFYSGWRAAH